MVKNSGMYGDILVPKIRLIDPIPLSLLTLHREIIPHLHIFSEPVPYFFIILHVLVTKVDYTIFY